MPELVFASGPRRGERFRFHHNVVLGRGALADLDLADSTVSRRHALISWGSSGCFLSDLESGNGTFLNGDRIQRPAPLSTGDLLKLGKVRLEFHGEGSQVELTRSSPSIVLSEIAADLSRSMVIPMSAVAAGETGKEKGKKRLAPSVEIGLLRKRQEFSAQVSRIMAETLEERELLSRILEAMMEALPQADRAFVAVLEEGSGQLVPRAARNRSGAVEEIAASSTLLRHVVERREAVLSADAGADSRDFRTAVKLGIKAVLCVPLLAGEEIYGALQVDNGAGGRPFTGVDLEALAAIAAPVALAVANARLHRRLLARELEENDLALARRIQQQFLPRGQPTLPGYRFATVYSPAMAVGGDLYDHLELPDGRVSLALGDVSGKGVSAALLMARAMSELRSLAGRGEPPARVLAALDRLLEDHGEEGMFVTLLLAILDPDSGRLDLVNAGHLRPLVRRASGSVEELELASGAPLGLGLCQELPVHQSALAPGDVVVTFSDGLSEAPSAQGGRFEVAGIRKALEKAEGDVGDILREILDSARSFVGTRGFEDDLTMLVLGRLPG